MTSADEAPESSASDRPTHPERPDDPDGAPIKPADPLGVIAIVLGCIGLVTFGFVLAIVTAVVAAAAGQQAIKHRRSPENAYLAFGLAVLDGVVFLVLHYLFKLPAFAG